MQPKRKASHHLPEVLRLISYCPLCEAAYSPLQARVLEEREDAHLLHIQCSHCHSSIVALVLSSAIGITSVGLVTDLTGDDVLRFKDAEALNTDEVLSFHHLLYPSNRNS
ncbi:MAG: hypothetical protein HY974_02565 [Candidatus Kerfeldbacteria bacterium]|nr:hypothetical protein [Candidatus Kerfeldbacteria bacterium]